MCDSYKINVNLFPTFSYFYLHSAFSRACNRFAKRRSRITGRFYTLLTYPRFYPLRPACLCDGFTHALFRLPLHLCYDWSLCLAQLTPAYGVTSMPFRPGCHRPFHRSVSLCSLLLLSQDCVLFSFGSVSFASAIHDIMLQHVLTSTVVTLRPFALYLPSWRILLLGGRCRIRTCDVLRSSPPSLAVYPFAFDHSANLPVFVLHFL